MNILCDNKFIKKLSEEEFRIVIENRPKLKFNEYGLNNHGEFIDYMNPHDNCYWDAIIPGYLNKIEYNKYIITTAIIGIFFIEDGNHKIAVRVNEPGFNLKKSRQDITQFISNYKQQTRIRGIWISSENLKEFCKYYNKYFYTKSRIDIINNFSLISKM
tara:strand:- start:195 stop:671 length:477 start_codon:yes stop_codon:yes gene_type:complete